MCNKPSTRIECKQYDEYKKRTSNVIRCAICSSYNYTYVFLLIKFVETDIYKTNVDSRTEELTSVGSLAYQKF